MRRVLLSAPGEGGEEMNRRVHSEKRERKFANYTNEYRFLNTSNLSGKNTSREARPVGRKGLEGCEAATARSAGAGAIAQPRKARFFAQQKMRTIVLKQPP
jgi:hypothetical protein